MLLGIISVVMVLFNPSTVRLIGLVVVQIPVIVLAVRLVKESGLKGWNRIVCSVGSVVIAFIVELLFAALIKGFIELGIMIF